MESLSLNCAPIAEHPESVSTSSACRPALMRERLLDLLRRGWTTPLDALQRAGCLSLSQRCGEFRREGIPVQDRWVALPSGKKVKAYRVEA